MGWAAFLFVEYIIVIGCDFINIIIEITIDQH